MFDVSFSELMVIAVIALLVIGPEKLPKVARTVGAFTGRMQRYLAQIKEEVNREMRFDELQKLQQEIKQSVENTQANMHQQVTELKTSLTDDTKPKKVANSQSKPIKASTSIVKPTKQKVETTKRTKVAAK
ncbi:MAG: twin-arginine translocase subunit TatB [Bdellovibrio sp.]|nr:twin-arginine translocase subunit TatB [Methylotenera sp.]